MQAAPVSPVPESELGAPPVVAPAEPSMAPAEPPELVPPELVPPPPELLPLEPLSLELPPDDDRDASAPASSSAGPPEDVVLEQAIAIAIAIVPKSDFAIQLMSAS
jgi:hypothetical protein